MASGETKVTKTFFKSCKYLIVDIQRILAEVVEVRLCGLLALLGLRSSDLGRLRDFFAVEDQLEEKRRGGDQKNRLSPRFWREKNVSSNKRTRIWIVRLESE
jgi:hypothetical protein